MAARYFSSFMVTHDRQVPSIAVMVATHILALGWPPGRVAKSEPGLFGHSSKIMAAMYWSRYFLSLWWLPDIF